MKKTLVSVVMLFSSFNVQAQELFIERVVSAPGLDLVERVKMADFDKDGVLDRVNCNSNDSIVTITSGRNQSSIFSWSAPEKQIKHPSSVLPSQLYFTNCEVIDIVKGNPSIIISTAYSNNAVGMRIPSHQYVMFNRGGKIIANTIRVKTDTKVGSINYKAAARSVNCTPYPKKLVDLGYKDGALCFFSGYDGPILYPEINGNQSGTLTALLKLQENGNGVLEGVDLSGSSGLMWSGGVLGTPLSNFPRVRMFGQNKIDGPHVMDSAFMDYNDDGIKDLFVAAVHASVRVAELKIDRSRKEGLSAKMGVIHQTGDGAMSEFHRIHALDENDSTIRQRCLYLSGDHGEHPNLVYDHLRCYESGKWVLYMMPGKISKSTRNFLPVKKSADGTVFIAPYDIISKKQNYFKIQKNPGTIDGHIDSVTATNQAVVVKGWSCQREIEAPITVQVFAGGSSGSGQFIQSHLASGLSEAAVKSRCNSNSNHRFTINIPKSIAEKHTGKLIYVHGIRKVSNGPNDLVASSGKFRIPAFTASVAPVAHVVPKAASTPIPLVKNSNAGAIDGYIDVVRKVNNDVVISGWACQINVGQSISVHTYLGNAAGQGGVMVQSAMANISSEKGVSDRCRTNGMHRFNLKIPKSVASKHVGKSIFVHGIRAVNNGANNLLNNSGHFKIPAI